MATAHRAVLVDLYDRLLQAGGHRQWWPASTRFEVIVGAVLTQNTSWRNVEKALVRLESGLPDGLVPAAVLALSNDGLADLIRPAGYYNVKAKRLRAVVRHFVDRWGGRAEAMAEAVGQGRCSVEEIRDEWLTVHGVGEETADSILLYAAGLPVFVCDAYTRRTMSRIGLLPDGASYPQMRRLFTDHLPLDTALFNDYHAQIVRLGSSFCRPRDPRCGICPVQPVCAFGRLEVSHA